MTPHPRGRMMENDYSSFDAMPEISRRAFVGSLIASAIVAGVPLPLERGLIIMRYDHIPEVLGLPIIEFKQFGLMFHYDRPCKGHEVWECPPYSCGGV